MGGRRNLISVAKNVQFHGSFDHATKNKINRQNIFLLLQRHTNVFPKLSHGHQTTDTPAIKREYSHSKRKIGDNRDMTGANEFLSWPSA